MGGGTNYESARSQKNSSSSRCMRACKEEGDLKIGKIERKYFVDDQKNVLHYFTVLHFFNDKSRIYKHLIKFFCDKSSNYIKVLHFL